MSTESVSNASRYMYSVLYVFLTVIDTATINMYETLGKEDNFSNPGNKIQKLVMFLSYY
jgi:hypothetical protein